MNISIVYTIGGWPIYKTANRVVYQSIDREPFNIYMKANVFVIVEMDGENWTVE